jgi:nitrogen-specific signal transduction histidine kinase
VLRVSNLIKGAHKAAQELSKKISAETDSTRRQELIAERDRILGAVVNRYDELESQK